MKRTRLLSAGMMLLTAFAAAARGEMKTREIEYRHGDTTLSGYFAYDDSAVGKRPGVLVVHEWYGLNDYAKRRAEQLAKMGYAAFALDMYGKGVLAKSVEEAGKLSGAVKGDRKLMRERARAGLDVLRRQDVVDGSKVAAIGYCFGGTTVLELARSGADVAGVVSFHGALDTPNAADAKNIRAKVLACHGGDDPFVPPQQVAAFEQEMRDAKADWQLIAYGGAVHSFTNPDVDKVGLKGAAYNANADRRSWQAMQDFFDEIFGNRRGASRSVRG